MPDVPPRLWRRVTKTPTCWLVSGATNGRGYAIYGKGPTRDYAHLIFYRWANDLDVIPVGVEVDHTCKVRNCVNPAHLEGVPAAENKRRAAGWAGGLCKRGHPVTPGVKCAECQRERGREHKRRLRADPVEREKINARQRADRAAHPERYRAYEANRNR